jgi:hypothetical protein
MNESRSIPVIAALVSVASGFGCGAKAPLGTAGAPDAYVVRTIDPNAASQPATVAKDTGLGLPAAAATGTQTQQFIRIVRGDGEIRTIAVTDDYFYWASFWEGVYRVPKLGGDIEVIEAGTGSEFEPLTTSHNDVFWVRSSFDDRDYPSVQIKHRADSGGGIGVLFSGDWGVTSSNELSNFQAGPSGVYMIAGKAGSQAYDLQQVPLVGGPITRVRALPDNWPTWLLDSGRVWFTDCPFGIPAPATSVDSGSCPIRGMTGSGDQTTTLANVPASNPAIGGADGDALYVGTPSKILRVSKADGAITVLVEQTGEGVGIGRSLLVDDDHVYFTVMTPGGPELRALAKVGGASVVLAPAGLLRDVRQIVQGARLLYVLHDQGHQISVVPKP